MEHEFLSEWEKLYFDSIVARHSQAVELTDSGIMSLVSMLERACIFSSPVVDEKILSAFPAALAHCLVLSYPRQSSSKVDKIRWDLFSKFKDIIEDDFGRKMSIQDMANEVGCDLSELVEQVRLATNTTPAKFYDKLRIRKLADRLRDTDQSLSSLAYEFGFSSQSHMTTMFRKHTGFTPGAYRAFHACSN